MRTIGFALAALYWVAAVVICYGNVQQQKDPLATYDLIVGGRHYAVMAYDRDTANGLVLSYAREHPPGSEPAEADLTGATWVEGVPVREASLGARVQAGLRFLGLAALIFAPLALVGWLLGRATRGLAEQEPG